MLARSRVALLLVTGLLLCTPFISYAEGTAADAMCIGSDQCPLGKGPTGKCDKAGGGTIGKPCQDLTSGFTTSGVCVSTIPPKCKATGTSDGKLDPGMAKLGEMLGKLMEQLMKGGGGGGGGGGESPYSGQQCTTLQPTADISLIQSNPACYYYQMPTDLGSTNPSTDPSGGMVATPTEGQAPLTVFFAFTNGNTACNTPPLNIDYGDGDVEQQQVHTGTNCSGISDTTQHTYTAAGSFPVRLLNANTGEVKGGVNITVLPAEETTPTPDSTTNTGGTNTGGANTDTGENTQTGGTFSNIGSALFNTPLTNLGNTGTVSTGGTNGNSSTGGSASTGGTNEGTGAALNFNTPQSIVQSIIQKNLPPGAYGDVKILDNGTTIVAGVRENNSEVAGFFGSQGSAGQGESIAARMCSTRPWASNFLSYIIPPSFFDSLCTWSGLTVGTTAKTTTPATVTATGSYTPAKTTPTSKPPVKATTTPPALSDAKVDIWASPATVPLGARTSVFWNSQGVTECIITSPDGSFTQTTLKGGASTVPLAAPTTFTISCVAPNGAHLTDNITVQIAL